MALMIFRVRLHRCYFSHALKDWLDRHVGCEDQAWRFDYDLGDLCFAHSEDVSLFHLCGAMGLARPWSRTC